MNQIVLATPQASPLDVFNFEGNEVRTVQINGEPWFIASDVCNVLLLKNSREAVSRLDDDEKGVISTDTLGGAQEMSAVSESGLYSLVFNSRKPEAKRFKKWVTSVLIPGIRKREFIHVSEIKDQDDSRVSTLELHMSAMSSQMMLMAQSLSAVSKSIDVLSRGLPFATAQAVKNLTAPVEKPYPTKIAGGRMTNLQLRNKLRLYGVDMVDMLEGLGFLTDRGGMYYPTKKAEPYLAESVGGNFRWNDSMTAYLTPSRTKKYR